MPDYLSEAQELFEYTRFLRRDFHRHPELGFQEVRTAGVVARELNAMGYEVTTGIAKTGVAALLEGERPGPTALVRFDMDALPIQEETGAEYASETAGVMHACGHDAHTAIGLTLARLLQNYRSELCGTVKLVFQPAEEGLGGAESMVAEGILENPRPDLSLSMHVWNERPVGWIGVANGPVMAAAEIFKVRIKGKGGHGAVPHSTIDPILASAQVISALQSIVSRNVAPLQTAVVSVTTVHGGEAFNVIPPAVELSGTIRTFEPEVRQMVLDRFTQVVNGIASAMGCDAEIELTPLTPAVINNNNIAGKVRDLAADMFPGDTIESNFRTMGSEDMAFMMQDIPGCYVFIGSANEQKGLNAFHHHPRFDIDEEILPKAVALMAASVFKLLS
ncbi:MAG: amidohydrolase [Chloroflexota bacterium]|nr:MAG: amidohydrolase [Chloroflexota bacterium]